MRKFVLCIMLTFFSAKGFCQMDFYQWCKTYVVQIGYNQNNKFISVGTGLLCYLPFDSNVSLNCAITAGHVIDFFHQNNITTVYVRPSWADSIKITDWIGIPIPLVYRGALTSFKPADQNLDLGCLVLPDECLQTCKYYDTRPITVFPYNNINNPTLGQQVVVYGYPAHIENTFSRYNFSVCTVKPGIVSWIAPYKINSEIDNFLLIECNATHGNSGGPVFNVPTAFDNRGVQLIGIVVGGYEDDTRLNLKFKGKDITDTVTKEPYYIVAKSGVTTIVRAELVKKFLIDIGNAVKAAARKN